MIKEFEPYHIGTKFENFVILQNLADELVPSLKKMKFKINEELSTRIAPMGVPFKTLAEKQDVKLELNFVANSINITGKESDSVTKIFKELIELVEKRGYELSKSIEFIEIIANATIKTSKPPVELIKKKVIFNFDDIEKKDKLPPVVVKYSTLLDGKKSELVELTIQPKLTNPDLLLMMLLYRRKTKKEIIDFSNSVGSKIDAVIKKLEA